MKFNLGKEDHNDRGVVEKSYLFQRDFASDNSTYENAYEKCLLSYALSNESLCYLLYVEKFPSLVSKIRSYKGVLSGSKEGNFEVKINSSESYLGFLLELNEINKYIVLDYFFTPNNCCLIKTDNPSLVKNFKEKILEFNFYDRSNSFWIDYDKLMGILERGSSVFHFHVNPNNENEFGIITYTSASQGL